MRPKQLRVEMCLSAICRTYMCAFLFLARCTPPPSCRPNCTPLRMRLNSIVSCRIASYRSLLHSMLCSNEHQFVNSFNSWIRFPPVAGFPQPLSQNGFSTDGDDPVAGWTWGDRFQRQFSIPGLSSGRRPRVQEETDATDISTWSHQMGFPW